MRWTCNASSVSSIDVFAFLYSSSATSAVTTSRVPIWRVDKWDTMSAYTKAGSSPVLCWARYDTKPARNVSPAPIASTKFLFLSLVKKMGCSKSLR